MKLRAFITIDKSPLRTVYEVWVHDLSDPDYPRKLPDHLGKYATLKRAESAKHRFDVHRVEIEEEQQRAAREAPS